MQKLQGTGDGSKETKITKEEELRYDVIWKCINKLGGDTY